MSSELYPKTKEEVESDDKGKERKEKKAGVMCA